MVIQPIRLTTTQRDRSHASIHSLPILRFRSIARFAAVERTEQ